MFDTVAGFGRTRMGHFLKMARRPFGLLALAVLTGGFLSGAVKVSSVEAQAPVESTNNTKKIIARQKAKRLERARKKRVIRKYKKIRKIKPLKKVRALRNSRPPKNLVEQDAYKDELNRNIVTLMTGCCATGSYTAFGADIKDMIKNVDDKDGLRVLPMLGGGAGTNVRDILYLRGVDMAILNTDVIDYYKGKPLYENLDKRIHYITKLFNEEVHLYAGGDISSLRDLDGKRVGFNNSNAEVTGAILFDKLGIKPAETMRISEGDGALALREGRLDAMMRVTGKPIRNEERLKAIFPQIRLLPIAYDPAFIGSHLPTQLTHDDYPELIKKGQVVPTIATRTILAVFNWKPQSDRYRRLEKFTNIFFDNYSKLRHSKNLHPKWAEVNLRAAVPGLTRFAPAKNWITAKTKIAQKAVDTAKTALSKNAKIDLMKSFKLFLAGRGKTGAGSGNSKDTEKLVSEFLRWQKEKR
jgi:uncharacterized protein